ncbi:MAG: hypothetical protein O2892_09620, partial [Actinomycetota bacterium]|nr:hypothetical protein [Actinomycetota bacterium]
PTAAGVHYSYAHIHRVINETANAIIEAAELPESGAVDAINFLVSATLERLGAPDRSLAQVARSYALVDYETDKALSGTKALERIVGWMHESTTPP